MDAFKAFVDGVAGPTTIFLAALGLVGALLVWYKQLTQPKVAAAALGLFIAFFVVGVGDENFRKIVAKPDNVPIVMLIVLVGFFTWLALRQAAINDTREAQGLPPVEATESAKALVWPDLVFIEFICAVFFTAGLLLWSIVLKAPLEPPSNPNETPNPSKAPWYFLGLQEMLVYYDPWMAGVVLPSLILSGLIALPFIDPNPKGNGYYTLASRRFAIGTYLFGFVVLWCSMIMIGTFLRGPNWNFFGPFERWDVHKLEPLVNVNLSEYIWVMGLKSGMPSNILWRELPGILLCVGYVLLLPPLLAKQWGTRDYAAAIRGSGLPGPLKPLLVAPFAVKAGFTSLYIRLGFIRYNVLMMHLLLMLSLPLKMILRWTLNLKYIVAIPEYFFNI